MPISIKNKALADEFIAALKNNDGADATRKMMTLGAEDTLAALLNFVKEKPDEALLLVIRARTYNFLKSKLGFMITVATQGYVPGGNFAGVEKADCHSARVFITTMRDDEKTLTGKIWGDPKKNAATHRFYPDEPEKNLRKRIVALAKAHTKIGPRDIRQAMLFSLGGAFGKSAAMSMTSPIGTTCILVARGIWHAAGINVVTAKTTVNVPLGLKAALPDSLYGYQPVTGNQLFSASEGDIFHIRGDNFANGNDSTHVGIITNVVRDGDTVKWSTVEGGSKNHVTNAKERVLEKHGNQYAFPDDLKDVGFIRPVLGYYSVTSVSGGVLMDAKAAKESGKPSSAGSESMPQGGSAGSEVYRN